MSAFEPTTATPLELSSSTAPSAPRAPAGAAPDAAAQVRESLTELADLQGRPLREHPEIYQRVHTALQEALAEIDSA